jgi:hypothetical protein
MHVTRGHVGAGLVLTVALSWQAPGLMLALAALLVLGFVIAVVLKATDRTAAAEAAERRGPVADADGRSVNLAAMPQFSYAPDDHGEINSLTESYTGFFSADDPQENPHNDAAEILRVVANAWDGCAPATSSGDDDDDEDDYGYDAACWSPGAVPRKQRVLVQSEGEDDTHVMLIYIVEARHGMPPAPDQDESSCSGPYAEPTIALLWRRLSMASATREEQQFRDLAFGSSVLATEERRTAEVAEVTSSAAGQMLLDRQLTYNAARLSKLCAERLLRHAPTVDEVNLSAGADQHIRSMWQAGFITPWEFAP